MTTESKRRVILVDDHELFRVGFAALLERYANVEIVAEATDGDEFLDIIEQKECDVVFMDISMERLSGDIATERAIAKYPDMKIITLSMFGDEHYYLQMVKAGARGFLLKNSSINEVVEAIEVVCNGGDYFSAELMQSLRDSMRSISQPPTEPQEEILSERELEILVCICQGLSNQEIADQLFISKRTVDKHRANIMEKSNCRNTANLVIYAIKQRLISF